jgi:phosphate transport system substrate-binding protein
MKKVFLITVTVFATMILVVSCGKKSENQTQTDELKGEITISGAFALYPLAVKWAEEFQKLHSEVKIDVSAGGAGKGMTDVLSGMADLGMVSREIYPNETEKGAVGFAVAKDAVVATINVENPLYQQLISKGLSQQTASQLWLGEKTLKHWEQILAIQGTTPIHLFTRSDACGAAETFAAWIGAKQEDLGGTAVFGDPGLADAVAKDKFGIGFNNLGFAYDEKTRKPNPGIAVFPLDVNENGVIDEDEKFYDTKDAVIQAISEGKYPSPPARDLYFVSKNVPTKPEVIAFLQFVLTEGQKYNIEVGYINMSQEKVDKGLGQLK